MHESISCRLMGHSDTMMYEWIIDPIYKPIANEVIIIVLPVDNYNEYIISRIISMLSTAFNGIDGSDHSSASRWMAKRLIILAPVRIGINVSKYNYNSSYNGISWWLKRYHQDTTSSDECVSDHGHTSHVKNLGIIREAYIIDILYDEIEDSSLWDKFEIDMIGKHSSLPNMDIVAAAVRILSSLKLNPSYYYDSVGRDYDILNVLTSFIGKRIPDGERFHYFA
jgi:hypothetical protein